MLIGHELTRGSLLGARLAEGDYHPSRYLKRQIAEVPGLLESSMESAIRESNSFSRFGRPVPNQSDNGTCLECATGIEPATSSLATRR